MSKATQVYPGGGGLDGVFSAYASGSYNPILMADSNGAVVGLSLTANRLYAMPFVSRFSMVVSKIVFENTSAAQSGAKVTMGIYLDGGGYPTTKFATSSECTLGAAAAIQEVAITATLAANTLYWLAMLSDTAVATLAPDTSINGGVLHGLGVRAGFGVGPWKAGVTGMMTSAPPTGMYKALSYTTTFPDPWGTPVAYTGNTGPVMALKAT